MACVSSVRLMTNINNRYSNEELPPQPTAEPKTDSELRTPSMRNKKRYNTGTDTDTDAHHHQGQQPPQYALPFMAAKSPISMSFATIIGAGERVESTLKGIH